MWPGYTRARKGRLNLRDIQGIYWDNGKENGNYYLGFRIYGLGFCVSLGIYCRVCCQSWPGFCCSSGPARQVDTVRPKPGHSNIQRS